VLEGLPRDVFTNSWRSVPIRLAVAAALTADVAGALAGGAIADEDIDGAGEQPAARLERPSSRPEPTPAPRL
jgi:hypothetical protein